MKKIVTMMAMASISMMTMAQTELDQASTRLTSTRVFALVTISMSMLVVAG